MRQICIQKPPVDDLLNMYAEYLKNPQKQISENKLLEAMRKYVKCTCKKYFKKTSVDSDVVNQVICLATFNAIKEKPIEKFIAYLNTVIGNECKSTLEKNAKVPLTFVDAEDFDHLKYAVQQDLGEIKLAEMETRILEAHLAKAIKELPLEQIEALSLRYRISPEIDKQAWEIYKNNKPLPYKDVAKLIGKKRDEVRALLFCAKRSIKAYIEKSLKKQNTISTKKSDPALIIPMLKLKSGTASSFLFPTQNNKKDRDLGLTFFL